MGYTLGGQGLEAEAGGGVMAGAGNLCGRTYGGRVVSPRLRFRDQAAQISSCRGRMICRDSTASN